MVVKFVVVLVEMQLSLTLTMTTMRQQVLKMLQYFRASVSFGAEID